MEAPQFEFAQPLNQIILFLERLPKVMGCSAEYLRVRSDVAQAAIFSSLSYCLLSVYSARREEVMQEMR
jgi:hypothetical protein